MDWRPFVVQYLSWNDNEQGVDCMPPLQFAVLSEDWKILFKTNSFYSGPCVLSWSPKKKGGLVEGETEVWPFHDSSSVDSSSFALFHICYELGSMGPDASCCLKCHSVQERSLLLLKPNHNLKENVCALIGICLSFCRGQHSSFKY